MFAMPGSRIGVKTAPRLSHGYVTTSRSRGTPVASSTYRPNPRARTIEHLTNNAAFTFAPQKEVSTTMTEVLNGASAGSITTSSYTYVVGTYATTNGYKYLFTSVVTKNYSWLSITQGQ